MYTLMAASILVGNMVGASVATAIALQVSSPSAVAPRARVCGGSCPNACPNGPERVLVGSVVTVRMDMATFNDPTLGESGQSAEWKYWVQWGIQRWNERAGARPILEWNDTPAAHTMYQPGNINIWLEDRDTSLSGGAAAATSMTGDCLPGASLGGRIRFFSRTPGGSNIIWSPKMASDGRGCVGGTCIFQMVIHELGHALGLDHSCETGGPRVIAS